MILLRGSKRFGVSIASQMKRFWHSRLSIPKVSNILSNDVVGNDDDELDDGVDDNVSSSSSSNINDLLRTSDGRKTVNGMLTRSSGKKKSGKIFKIVFIGPSLLQGLRNWRVSLFVDLIEKDRKKEKVVNGPTLRQLSLFLRRSFTPLTHTYPLSPPPPSLR